MLRALANQAAGDALVELDAAIADGVDAGQLAEQLIGCLRDLLVLSVGSDGDMMLHSAASEAEALTEIAHAWGTPNLLAASQILDHALGRMRQVTHTRVLLEMALIRIASLEDMQVACGGHCADPIRCRRLVAEKKNTASESRPIR